MTRFCHRSDLTEQLVADIETSPGSGVFEPDDRLRVEEVALRTDQAISTARLAVRLDNDFDTAAARARYRADRRIVIRTDENDPADRVVLFEGYPPIVEAQWRGGPGRAGEAFGFTAVHVYERLSRLRESWIYGRQMRSAEIEDGLASDPAAWGGRSVLVSALSCVFNFDGSANCAPQPLTVTDAAGNTRSIFIFTHDDDPKGIPWTYLNALRYLVWFYAPRCGPVDVADLLDATEPFVNEPPDGGASQSGSVNAVTSIRRLLAAPDSLACEAVNLVEALAMLADESGVHVTADTLPGSAGPGSVRSRLRIWSAGDGPPRPLHLVRGGFHADGQLRYDARNLSADDIFRANEVVAATIRWDDGRIVNAPIVLGGVKRYEMTLPLVPGWLPTANLDNVASQDRVAAKELALTPHQVAKLADLAEQSPWFRMYHRDGSEFSGNRFVGRRWVLNEDGRFDGNVYNRNGPFDDYQPFDFSTVAGSGVTRKGLWSRRSRRLLPTITRDALGARFGVLVEVSFDSGVTWHRPQGAVSVLGDPTAIVFEATNPTQITPPGVDPIEQNLWYAIIDQTCRVRVTALIESDERLSAAAGPDDQVSPTLLTTSRVELATDRFRFESRDGTTNALAAVNPGGSDINRDDSAAIARFAGALADRTQDRRVIASPVIGWLETRFAIGDEIERIRGRGVSFLTRAGGRTTGPVVVGRRHRFSGGRWQTELELEHDRAPLGAAGGA